jgi:hypothetical protein
MINFKSDFLLKLNIELIHKINDNLKIRHLVVENSPVINSNKYIELIQGISEDEIKEEYNKLQHLTNIKLKDPKKGYIYGDWPHSMGLNKCLKQKINSRFILTLDPDCFIFSSFTNMINHMINHNLTFLGVPLGTASRNKRWYKPCVTALMIDTNKFNIKKLDFTPARFHKEGKMKHKHILTLVGMRIYSHYKKNNYQVMKMCNPTDCNHCLKILKSEQLVEQSKKKLKGLTETFFWPSKEFFGIHFHVGKNRTDKDNRVLEDGSIKIIIQNLLKQKNFNHKFGLDKSKF